MRYEYILNDLNTIIFPNKKIGNGHIVLFGLFRYIPPFVQRKGGILASEHKRRNERQNKHQHSFHHKHILISIEIDLAYAIYLP